MCDVEAECLVKLAVLLVLFIYAYRFLVIFWIQFYFCIFSLILVKFLVCV